MKISKIIQGLIIVLIIQACASSVNTTKLSEDGNTAYNAGNYETALIAWEQIIENSESKEKSKSVVVPVVEKKILTNFQK